MPARHPLQAAIAAALLAAGCAPASYAAAACQVNSGARTAALVELYTSEGCSSCPPADAQLRELRSRLDADALVVPLALHVTYWDGIGWKDPFAQPRFDQRQRGLLERRRQHVAYTPQFFVNGDELRDWRAALPDAVRRINAIPAPVAIALTTTALAGGRLRVDASARAADARADATLYVALTESALVSRVLRGENGGATLRHDDTARLWFGPFALAHGQAAMRQTLTLPPDWRRTNLRALAFVQDADAHVLQAVEGAACAAAAPGGSDD